MQSPLDMLVFAKVVEFESFPTAAQRLGISRSAASKHVSRLETVLGARLLNRTTRKLSLTEAGHSIREHCRRMAAEVEASEISVQPLVSRPQGLFRVSAPGAFGSPAPGPAAAGISGASPGYFHRSRPQRPVG